MENSHSKHSNHSNQGYASLLVMAVLSYICMYFLMYSMTDSIRNVYMNINQVYMAGLMTMPMIVIEMVVMRHMYKDRKLNAIIISSATVGMFVFYFLIRQQSAVQDKEFLRSMIPHHSGAILMCEKANITDPEIVKLCEEIKASQQREIEQMKAKLSELRSRN